MTTVRIASVALWINALGFGVPCLIAMKSLLGGKGIAFIFGFPTYGQGPLERIGVPTTVPLLVVFLLTCIIEGIAGWLLWSGQKSGAFIALGAIPLGAIFWWGFALPIPPVLAVIRSGLILLNWGTLK